VVWLLIGFYALRRNSRLKVGEPLKR
jgi:hypothetical protein